MKLPAEWESVVSRARCLYALTEARVITEIVERCYALTQKPVRELTDAEIDAINTKVFGVFRNDSQEEKYLAKERQVARDIVAAHIAKQREPEVVKFRAARNKVTGFVDMYKAEVNHPQQSDWKWLEPAQTFEVKLP